jgi:GAF domain-containing protein
LDVGKPVRLCSEDWNRLDLPSGKVAPCLAVPVCSEIPEATAVALFGAHETGNDIDADEREMLETLARRAAAAYERVIADLLRKEVSQLRTQLAALQSSPRTALGNPSERQR